VGGGPDGKGMLADARGGPDRKGTGTPADTGGGPGGKGTAPVPTREKDPGKGITLGVLIRSLTPWLLAYKDFTI